MRIPPMLCAALAALLAFPAQLPAQTQVPLAFVQPLPPAAVREVQERLRRNGAYAGAVDGVWGPDSQVALDRFQQSRGMAPTASINEATARALGLTAGELLGQPPPPPLMPALEQPLNAAAVRNVQQQLRARGFYRGASDGIWGPATQEALARFQQGQGLQPTGQVNPATAQALGLDPNNLAAPRMP